MEKKRKKQLAVGHRDIQKEARRLGEELGLENFHAADGWVSAFVKRHNLSHRRATHIGQQLPEMLLPKILNFFKHVRRQQKILKISNDDIMGMDECAGMCPGVYNVYT